jgi:hypothetical protein
MQGVSRLFRVAAMGLCAFVVVACAGGSGVSQDPALDGPSSTSSTLAVTATSTTVAPAVSIPVESPTTTARQNPTTTVASGPSAAEIAAQKEARYQADRLALFNECMANMQAIHDDYVRRTTASNAQAEAEGWVTPAIRETWRAYAAIALQNFQNSQQSCRTSWGF